MSDTLERKADPVNITAPRSRNPSGVHLSSSSAYPMPTNSGSASGRAATSLSSSFSGHGVDPATDPPVSSPSTSTAAAIKTPNMVLAHKDSFGKYDDIRSVSAQTATPLRSVAHRNAVVPEDVLDSTMTNDQDGNFITSDSSAFEATLQQSDMSSTTDNVNSSPVKRLEQPQRTSSLSLSPSASRTIPGGGGSTSYNDQGDAAGHQLTVPSGVDATLEVNASTSPSHLSPGMQMQTLSSSFTDSSALHSSSPTNESKPFPGRNSSDARNEAGSAVASTSAPTRESVARTRGPSSDAKMSSSKRENVKTGQSQSSMQHGPSNQANGTSAVDASSTRATPYTTMPNARPSRLPGTRAVPQLPSAQNVAPAPPPAMYWSRVPVHGSVPRRSFRAHTACLADEVMWLFGGCDAKGCFYDLYCFDTETMCWSKPKVTGDVPPARRAHSATMVDRRLYVFAGGDGPYYFNDLYIFDTIALRWSKPDVFGQAPSPRRAHTSSYYDGQLIIFGGGNGVGALNDVYSLDITDPNKLEWRKIECRGKVPIGRGYHSSNLVDGKLIVIGGSDGHMSFDDIHILKLDTRTWYQVKTDEVHNRLGHTATQVGSYLFIVGGHDSHSYTPDILTLNLVNLQWEPRTVSGKKPPGRGYHQAWLRDGRLFVHGGFDGKEIYDDLYYIDLSACAYLPQITSFSVELDDE